MNHLTDEELAARLDGTASDASEQHLESCEDCRARLADLASLDESLGRVLAHDPGEAYFASFADRVTQRIASGARPAAARQEKSWFAWWNSPRSLAWAGGALALVAVAALAVVVGRDRSAHPIVAGAPSDVGRAVTPPAASAPAARREAALRAAEESPSAAAERDQASAKQKATKVAGGATPSQFRAQVEGQPKPVPAPQVMSRGANAPMRLQELKTLPNGEQVPVANGVPPVGSRPAAVPTPSGFFKRGATLMSPQASARDDRAAQNVAPPAIAAAPAPREEKRFASAPPASAPAPLTLAAPSTRASAAPPPSAVQSSEVTDRLSNSPGHRPPTNLAEDAVTATPVRLCGHVHDARGRALAGVVLSVAETGASTTSASDGTFCLEAPNAHPTIEAFSVGYRVFRGDVSGEASLQPLAIALEPVEALPRPLGLGKATSGERLGFTGGGSPGGPATMLATQAARAATAIAKRAHTVDAWQRAADQWVHAAAGLAGAPDALLDARFHVAEAWVSAWRIGHTATERAAANGAVGDYLAAAPAGPLRDLADGWRRELAN